MRPEKVVVCSVRSGRLLVGRLSALWSVVGLAFSGCGSTETGLCCASRGKKTTMKYQKHDVEDTFSPALKASGLWG